MCCVVCCVLCCVVLCVLCCVCVCVIVRVVGGFCSLYRYQENVSPSAAQRASGVFREKMAVQPRYTGLGQMKRGESKGTPNFHGRLIQLTGFKPVVDKPVPQCKLKTACKNSFAGKSNDRMSHDEPRTNHPQKGWET